MKNYQPGDLVIDKLTGNKMIVRIVYTNDPMKDHINCRYICNKGIMRWESFHINELLDYDEKPAPITENYQKLKPSNFNIF